MKKNVLFVCLGNICRSPAAEGAFINLLYQENRAHEFYVDSAGTSGYHNGEKPDRRMIERAEERGILLPSLSRKFLLEDFKKFDYIICMDKSNFGNIKALDQKGEYSKKILMMSDFLKNKNGNDIPDPYYGTINDFDLVLDLVQEGSIELLEYIDKHSLVK